MNVVDFFLAALGIVFFWRGAWNLIDTYFLPRYFLASNFVSLGLGLAMVYAAVGAKIGGLLA
jgi:hypothetical protein